MKKIFQIQRLVPAYCLLQLLLTGLVCESIATRVHAQTVVAPSPLPGSGGATLGPPVQGWDPYSTTPQYGNFPAPSLPPNSFPSSQFPSSYPPPSSFPPATGTPPAAFANGPNSYFPQQPAPLYQPSQPFVQQPATGNYSTIPYERFLEHLSFRYTFLPALNDEPDTLQTQDFEFSATALFPDFLFSQQPLLVTPAFVLHLWDGPANGIHDLPGSAYSAYLDLAWNPELTPRLFAELGFRVGAYTDFETINTNSVRYQGLGVANVRVTPTTTIKAGVVYIDRLDIKLLPVIGVLYEPDSLTRFDITFPYPRLSRYWTTIGDRKVWWYIGGEYGGGSWTIQRFDFGTMMDEGDQIDINEYRVFAGLEATHPNRLRVFFEVGYVWDREVIYRVDKLDDLKVDDTVMIRTGFNF